MRLEASPAAWTSFMEKKKCDFCSVIKFYTFKSSNPWIWIRIRIETNTDPQICIKLFLGYVMHTVVCFSIYCRIFCYVTTFFLLLQGILDSYEKELTVSGSQMDSERVAALEKNLETFRWIFIVEYFLVGIAGLQRITSGLSDIDIGKK